MIAMAIPALMAKDFFSLLLASFVRVKNTDNTKKGVKTKNIFKKVEMIISISCPLGFKYKNYIKTFVKNRQNMQK